MSVMADEPGCSIGRSNGEFAHRRRFGNRGDFQPAVRDFAAQRRRRQQRVSQPFLDQAGEHAKRIRFHLDVELQFLLRRRMLDQRPEPVRMTGQHQLLPQQPADIDLLLPRQPAAARPHRHDLVAAEALHGQMQIGRRPVDHGKVHLSAVQPFDQMPAVALDDAQRDAGIAFDGAPGEPRGNHAAHGRNQPQHHPPRRRPSGGLDIVANLIDLPDDAGRPRQQQAAGLGQHHAAAVAGEQLGAQFMFEQLDLTAERGLCYPQACRRLC